MTPFEYRSGLDFRTAGSRLFFLILYPSTFIFVYHRAGATLSDQPYKPIVVGFWCSTSTEGGLPLQLFGVCRLELTIHPQLDYISGLFSLIANTAHAVSMVHVTFWEVLAYYLPNWAELDPGNPMKIAEDFFRCPWLVSEPDVQDISSNHKELHRAADETESKNRYNSEGALRLVSRSTRLRQLVNKSYKSKPAVFKILYSMQNTFQF